MPKRMDTIDFRDYTQEECVQLFHKVLEYSVIPISPMGIWHFFCHYEFPRANPYSVIKVDEKFPPKMQKEFRRKDF